MSRKTQQGAPRGGSGYGDDEAARNAAALDAGDDLDGPEISDGEDELPVEFMPGDSRFPGDTEGFQPDDAPSTEDTARVEQEPAGGKKWAGKYESPEELEAAHQNLQQVLGRQGEEIRQSRERLARLEGQQEAIEKIREKKPEGDETRKAFVEKRTRVYHDRIGMDEQEARELAEADFDLVDTVASERVGQESEKYRPLLERNQKFERANRLAEELRDETDGLGQPIRPDWDEVKDTPEFSRLMAEHPGSLDTREGIELLYLKARIAHAESAEDEEDPETDEEDPETVAKDVKQQAREVVRREKRRASGAIPGAGGDSKSQPSEEEQELAEIYGTNRSRHPMAGGSFRE